jgi:1,4-dihydroxy-2-naphthoate polyprenyltransferase
MKMTVKSFFKLVEIQTKVASVIPYLLGLSYTLYHFQRLNAINMIVMFFSMIIFDMSATAINNYYDYTRAIKKHGYGYETHNSIGQNNLSIKSVRITIIMMIIISALLGLYLVYLTNWILLLFGALCFIIGIIYSYGPMPISRTPFGEIFSGTTMGLGIPFIVLFINVFNQDLININIANAQVFVDFDLFHIISIVVVSIPAIFCIANIMLANNICDIDEDIENKRHTLPIVIGKKPALKLLASLYYLSYVAIIVAVIIKALPIYSLIALLTIIPVRKNIALFKSNPTKKDTFGAIVGCFVIMNIALILTILIPAIIIALL